MDSLFGMYGGEASGVGPYAYDHSYFEPAMKELRLRFMKAKVLGLRITGIAVAEWFARVLRLELSSSENLYRGPLFIHSELLGQKIPVRSVPVGVTQIWFGGDPVFQLEAA